jgi:CheY-like chemotaxis protein
VPSDDLDVRNCLAGVHVMLVDPDLRSRGVLAHILRYCGAVVTEVASPGEAFHRMAVVRPDAVTVVLVPERVEGGATMVRGMRSRLQGARGDLPVVAVLAAGGAEVAARARAAGFGAVLARPLDPWDFCRTLAGMTRGSRTPR